MRKKKAGDNGSEPQTPFIPLSPNPRKAAQQWGTPREELNESPPACLPLAFTLRLIAGDIQTLTF